MAIFGSETLFSGLHPSFPVACRATPKANTTKIDPTLLENMACGASASGGAVSARMLALGGGFGPRMSMPAPPVRRRAGRKEARSKACLGRRVAGSACVGGSARSADAPALGGPDATGANRGEPGPSRARWRWTGSRGQEYAAQQAPRGGMRCRPGRARGVGRSSQGRRWAAPAAGRIG
jgi:hypothetical protein